MNKEFLDPNTKYSDQKVDLAKMPGVLQQVEDIQDALDTTNATAGEVLKVVTPGGAPVWGEAGGGGEIYIIGSTTNRSTGVETLNKTAQEIIDAIKAGKMCFIRNYEDNTYEGFYNSKSLYSGEWDETSAGFRAYDTMNSVDKVYLCKDLSAYPATASE